MNINTSSGVYLPIFLLIFHVSHLALQRHILGKDSVIAVTENTVVISHSLVVHSDIAMVSHFSYNQIDISYLFFF